MRMRSLEDDFRRLEAPEAPSITTHTINDRLNSLALTKLVATLKGYGNVLTPEHKRALRMILEGFTALASKQRIGRWGYGLGCGGGKTEATKAWVVANYELGWPYSVAISSSQVQDLDSIKRDLIKQGVPAEDVGLIHSYGKIIDKETGELVYLGKPPVSAADLCGDGVVRGDVHCLYGYG